METDRFLPVMHGLDSALQSETVTLSRESVGVPASSISQSSNVPEYGGQCEPSGDRIGVTLTSNLDGRPLSPWRRRCMRFRIDGGDMYGPVQS